jgi:hypothetical protein
MADIETPDEFAKRLFAKRDDWELVTAMIAARDADLRAYVLDQFRDLSEQVRYRQQYAGKRRNPGIILDDGPTAAGPSGLPHTGRK